MSLLLQVSTEDQNKEKKTLAGESATEKEKLSGRFIARGRCCSGTWKRALEITGCTMFINQGIKELTLKILWSKRN